MSETVTLKRFRHLGADNPLLLLCMVEALGQPQPVYHCGFCRRDRPHYEKAVDEHTYAVCSMCGEVSLVVEKSVVGLGAGRASPGSNQAPKEQAQGASDG